MSTRPIAAAAGVACAAVAIGVSQLVSSLVAPASAPVIALGSGIIDMTPEPVKRFAIAWFGVYDKVALILGIGLILLAVAVAVGLLSLRRIEIGYTVLALFGLLGAVAALNRPGASLWWLAPSIVGAGLAATVLWWLFGRTYPAGSDIPLPGRKVDRRGVLIAFGAAGAAGVAGWRLGGTDDVETARAAIRLPAPTSVGASAADGALDVKGLTPYLTSTSNDNFYRVDTVLTIPRVHPDEYRLSITGRVGQPMELSYQDLLDRPLVEREITLSCVSNQVGDRLAGNARWLGVPLKELLEEAGPEYGADQVVGRSTDGYTCGVPTEVCVDGRDALIAVGMNGEPLPLRHGFPVRMLVPGMYGYVSATKWLVELELSSFDEFDQYWVRRDWDAVAPVKTFSRIDTPTATRPFEAGRTAVAGVAWAQHRGIGAVEVRVDDGAWREAELGTVISTDTWRQWVWHWQATPGRHTLQVRATDQDGTTQPRKRRPPFPDGATGWHSVVVTVS